MTKEEIIEHLLDETKKQYYSYAELEYKVEQLKRLKIPYEKMKKEIGERDAERYKAFSLENVTLRILRLNGQPEEISKYLKWTEEIWDSLNSPNAES